ncbi:branched-chain amino acid transport system 2 carrier protein [Clostridium acetireducens DSM 10703]|uniref:Branched-chain amino acid transport system carrier protein n=1 Tax=Clostridium acetireducens DSM 10703 TaxID=1121290 RepID=A0A1E8F0H7_9CLOT|nr:branched-chain amino acid transport system II carrier protein [Clostridium acetireducens]OFI06953.1 branched-chain amino acid transport system 2 carrier protein [Clostridium acetireducens DSM 10703]
MKSSSDFIVIGFALFAMFFGAGNLIFPPYLGHLVGDQVLIGIIGFLITGVGLPLSGIIACAKCNGTFSEISSRVGKIFSLVATSALVIAIGPMLAVPRTAATTFELGVHPVFPSVSPVISSIVYFGIVLFFVLRPSAIVDNIGKILTPALLVMLSVIIIKGIVNPIGTITPTDFQGTFSKSLLEGYQTMDVMTSVMFASIILASIRSKGYEESEVTKVTVKSAVVAVGGLAFIYGGLMYLGAQTTTMFPKDVARTELLTEIVRLDLGSIGSVILGIAVGLACLTTAIGLISTGAEFFSEKIFNKKISYNALAIVLAVISAILAVRGVDQIVKLAVPVLTVLYPIVIVLIIMTLMGDLVKDNRIVRFTTYVTLVISLIDTINGLTNLPLTAAILKVIPLSSVGFAWIIPSVLAFIIASFIYKNKDNNSSAIEG